jgi:hypothetical protein
VQDKYESLLLGARQNPDDRAIYRPHFDLLLNSGMPLRIAFKGMSRKAKVWLRYQARQQDAPNLASRFACFAVNFFRGAKQFKNGLLARQR